MHKIMNKIFTIGSVCLSLILIVGCSSADSKAGLGALGGGLAGGIIGHQVDPKSGRYIGAAVGALVSYQLVKHLTKEDQAELSKSTQQTASTGETQTWENPKTGVRGQTKVIEENASPAKADQTARNCRTVEQQVELADGTIETESITLCQGEDGSWQAI